jgi:hypothetical protein
VKLAVVLLIAAIVAYVVTGAVVYGRDVSSDWCSSGDRPFDPGELAVYVLFWPYRIASDDFLCD